MLFLPSRGSYAPRRPILPTRGVAQTEAIVDSLQRAANAGVGRGDGAVAIIDPEFDKEYGQVIVCAQSPGAELTLQVPGGGLGQRDGFAQIFLLGGDGGHARG